MKQITELSEKEILELTYDELDQMVKYKMAENGIKILTKPSEPDYLSLPQKDWPLYSVGGVDKTFVMREDAESVANLLNEIKGNSGLVQKESINYDSNLSFGKIFADDNYSWERIGDVTPIAIWRHETMQSAKEAIEKNKETKKSYDVELAEFKEADNQSADIKATIYGLYHDTCKKYREYEDMKYRYNEYLSLANDDDEMAMKFLKKAYGVNRETENYILYGTPEDIILNGTEII